MGQTFELREVEVRTDFIKARDNAIFKMEDFCPLDMIVGLGTEMIVAERWIDTGQIKANAEPCRKRQQRLRPPQFAGVTVFRDHALHGVAGKHENQIELAGQQQPPKQRAMQVLQRYRFGQPSAAELIPETRTIAVQGHGAML